MPRAILSEAERLARKRERTRRSLSDASYRHYNPSLEGFGSTAEWLRKAEAILSGEGIGLAFGPGETDLQQDLRTLNLKAMPGDRDGLKRAYRNTLFDVHPDHGGTTEATIAATDAFERLARHFRG